MSATPEKKMNDTINDQQEKGGVTRRTFVKVGVAAAGAFAASTLDFTSRRHSKLATSKLAKSAYAGEPGLYDSCRVVVFGSDSLRIDYAETLRNQSAPALSQLNPPIAGLCNNLTETQPGWAIIWSGLPSTKIRAWSNKPLKNNNGVVICDCFKKMHSGYHIMEKLMNSYDSQGKDFYPVWITGKGTPITGLRIRNDGTTKGGPHYHVRRKIIEEGHQGVYLGDVKRENGEVYESARDHLDEAVRHDNFLVFVQFRDPDQTGHDATNGRIAIPPGQTDYDVYMDRALEVDQHIANLMNILPEIQDPSSPAFVNVIYCSDHGFDFESQGDRKDGHSFSPHGMLATNFDIMNIPIADQASIGRLIYKKAGGNPDWTFKGNGIIYRMSGWNLV